MSRTTSRVVRRMAMLMLELLNASMLWIIASRSHLVKVGRLALQAADCGGVRPEGRCARNLGVHLQQDVLQSLHIFFRQPAKLEGVIRIDYHRGRSVGIADSELLRAPNEAPRVKLQQHPPGFVRKRLADHVCAEQKVLSTAARLLRCRSLAALQMFGGVRAQKHRWSPAALPSPFAKVHSTCIRLRTHCYRVNLCQALIPGAGDWFRGLVTKTNELGCRVCCRMHARRESRPRNESPAPAGL